MKYEDMGTPIDRNERYLYGINVRLDALIEQVNSLVEHIAKKEGLATTQAEVKLEVSEPAPSVKSRIRK